MDSLLEEGNVDAWINKQFPCSDQELSALSIKLQLQEQDLESTLEYKTAQLVKELSTYTDELRSLQAEALQLKKLSEHAEAMVTSLETQEIGLLHRDLNLVESLAHCKSALQEIQFFDDKATHLTQEIDCSKPAFGEIAQQLKTMHSSLKYLEGLPLYSTYENRLSHLLTTFGTKLDAELQDQLRSLNWESINDLAIIYKDINREEHLANNLLEAILGQYSSEYFDTTTLKQVIEKLSNAIQSEVSKLQTLLTDPSHYIENLISAFIQLSKPSTYFIQQDINDWLSSYNSTLLPFLQLLRSYCSIKIPSEITWHIISSFISKEKFYLDTELNTAYIKAINERRSPDDPPYMMWRNMLSFLILDKVKSSWNRCMKLSYGIIVENWVKEVENVINTRLRILKKEIERYDMMHITMVDSLDFSVNSSEHGQFSWKDVEICIKIYELVLDFYSGLKELGREFRQELISIMTTGYFSPEFSLQKQLQEHFLTQNLELNKGLTSLLRKLREGGFMLSNSFDMLEKILDSCKESLLRVFYFPIYSRIVSYPSREFWLRESSRMSPSPSEDITSIGEHVLLMLQQLETDVSSTRYSDAWTMEFSVIPDEDLPHSLGVHFWMNVILNSFLSVYSSKILQLKQVSEGGKAQLLADLDYILHIVRTLGGKGGLVTYSSNLNSLAGFLRGENEASDPLSMSLVSKIIK